MTAKNVFGSRDFAKWSTNFILVELDFPKGAARSKIPPQYLELAQALKVTSYPTVWFVETTIKENNPQLNPINKIVGGYRDANAWINQANKILKK